MIAAMLLGGLLAWLAIAFGAGMAAYRWKGKRWLQVTLTLIVLWLPFWDVIPGYILYRQAVREVGGVRIYKTVEADGYLDLTDTDCVSCWSRLVESKYRYLEVRRTGNSGVLKAIERGTGYYVYRLAPLGDRRCQAFESLPNARRLASLYRLGERCVYSTFSESQSSNVVISRGSDSYQKSSPWPVTLDWTRVVDRRSPGQLAEAVQVHFFSRLSRLIDIPSWSYTKLPTGERIRIHIEEVLKPV